MPPPSKRSNPGTPVAIPSSALTIDRRVCCRQSAPGALWLWSERPRTFTVGGCARERYVEGRRRSWAGRVSRREAGRKAGDNGRWPCSSLRARHGVDAGDANALDDPPRLREFMRRAKAALLFAPTRERANWARAASALAFDVATPFTTPISAPMPTNLTSRRGSGGYCRRRLSSHQDGQLNCLRR
jgi:hypothetical protein